jgi:biotin synthase
MNRKDILDWLHQEDAPRLEELWRQADSVRKASVGDAVHFRGLIEISNHCVRRCGYCGLRAPNAKLPRYRMSAEEIIGSARQAMRFGYGTVVLQAGEDPGITKEWIADLVRRIKTCGTGGVPVRLPSSQGTEPKSTAGSLDVKQRVDSQASSLFGVEGANHANSLRNNKDRGETRTGETPMPQLAVTLSLGERSFDELAAWKAAGADRYLLRFETSNRELFDRIHPPPGNGKSDRIAILRQLRELGYEVGSGVMIGIPGQSYEDLADDILLFAKLDLDMIGVGPYLPHPQTPLAKIPNSEIRNPKSHQVPNTELMTYKVVALARLVCPRANIPSTTALATLNRASGREMGLQRGANIVMPNLTPPQYRAMYEIYPAKACIYETADACHDCMAKRVAAIGRTVGVGRGDSPNSSHKATATSQQAATTEPPI